MVPAGANASCPSQNGCELEAIDVGLLCYLLAKAGEKRIVRVVGPSLLLLPRIVGTISFWGPWKVFTCRYYSVL